MYAMSIIKAEIDKIINYNGNVAQYDRLADKFCYVTPQRIETYCYGSNGCVQLSYSANDRCRIWEYYEEKRYYIK